MLLLRFFSCMLFISLLSIKANAQSLISNVISTNGEQSSNSTVSLSFTVGESVVSSENSQIINNCGFHQGAILPVSVTEVVKQQNITFVAYPNPFRDELFVDVYSPFEAFDNLELELYDAGMKRILKQKADAGNANVIRAVGIDPGVYFLYYKTSEGLSRPLRLVALPF